jgi:hypothetical protein
MPHHRFAADQGNVERLVFADQLQDAVDEGVAAEVAQLAEGDAAAQVGVTVGVAARASERALTSYFDAEQRDFAGENAHPGG